MKVPLLTTKLYVPSPRPNLVPRAHLIKRLDDGLCQRHKLTLVSAPAGFGKTTLVSAWAVSYGSPVAWLSLDEGDNDLARFLTYLAAALRMAGVEIEGGISDAEAFLTTLVNQVSLVPEPFLLVLDDYHLVTAQPVHDALAFFLDHMPGSVHLVIATRADPPLPVARLRARGQLTELRLSDLRFTSDEAAQFLGQVMGLELSTDDITALASRTEGWVAGLQMAALSLQGKDDVSQFVAAFTGSNRYILDYLLEEVLRREPEYVQTFLLQTSILDRLCGSLCEVVIGDWRLEIDSAKSPISSLQSQAVLEHLESSNLFILPLDNERHWYRYHRLFADLLRQRLLQVYPDLVPVLHRRASEWFEQNGLTAEAIDHVLAAEDFERAASLIDRNAEATLMRGEAATFLRWTDLLPGELVRARPSLCVLYAWMLLMRGQPLQVIESLLQDADVGDEIAAGRAAALRGLIAAFHDQMDRAAELSRRALEQLPEEEQFVRTFAVWILKMTEVISSVDQVGSQNFEDVIRMSQRAGNVLLSVMVVCNQAELLMRQGQLHQAAATYRRALDLATDARGQRLPIAGQVLIGLGELLREWNDLDAAERLLLEGIELTEQWTEVGPFEAYIVLARIRWARGDRGGAWEAIQKARDLTAKFDLTELDDLSVALFQARLWVAQGDFGVARRWAEDRGLYKYIGSPLREKAGDSYEHRVLKYELIVLARLLVAQGQSEEALALLEPLVSIAEWRRRPGMLIEIYILEALARRALGDIDQALIALERALALAEPEGYVRIFADEGDAVGELLREAAQRGIAVEYVAKLLAAFEGSKFQVSGFGLSSDLKPETSKPGTFEPETLAESLSARELEVLRLLNTHLSSTEIAERLCVSANTVRFHIKNIYGKLGVHSRSDAVKRAGELGLL
ncbi:MAG: tetratricopeptide repeat protein [Anaerolineae bacterium]|nr:tetratricopeptide repeat protein [Anaerolineae bacterium]